MGHWFEFFIAIAFHGWAAAVLIVLVTLLAVIPRYQHRASISPYHVITILSLIIQLSWALFAMVSTAEHSISSAACLSGIFGFMVLPAITFVDLIVLAVVARKNRIKSSIWVKLGVTKILFGFVVFCAVLRSALLCTV